MNIHLIEEHKCFGGVQYVYSHFAESTDCVMRFALYLPPMTDKPVPALYWLSGLTATEQNFITKAGAQRMAAQLGLALIAPDTSPRNVNIPGDRQVDDFGEGAGFYLDATRMPWAKNYQMYRYVTKELIDTIEQNFPIVSDRRGLIGHSMGGHGALTVGIKNPDLFHSLSAFAPICSASRSPWGIKAFTGYLGEDRELWQSYDACFLIESLGWPHGEILVDQGSDDPFLETQLKPDLFQQACEKAQVPLNLRMQPGYDHNYYFIASFIEQHLEFHAQNLLLTLERQAKLA